MSERESANKIFTEKIAFASIFRCSMIHEHYVIYWGLELGRYVNAIDGPIVKAGASVGDTWIENTARTKWVDCSKKRLFKAMFEGNDM